MIKEFVPYDLALKIKNLGFNEPCFVWADIYSKDNVYMYPTNENNMNQYEETVSIPLFQQVFRWFREKYNLLGNIYIVNFGSDEYCYDIYDLFEEKDIYDNFDGSSTSYMGTFENYEESEIACLEKLIEIVESSILKSK
jgi:hypothetical protein